MKVTNHSLNADSNLESFVEANLRRQMLQAQAGQQIFCRKCNRVLDWRNAVSVDVSRDGNGGALLFTKVLCGQCADVLLPGFPERIGALEDGRLHIEITDGRTYNRS